MLVHEDAAYIAAARRFRQPGAFVPIAYAIELSCSRKTVE